MKGHSTALLLVGILCLLEPPAWAGTSRTRNTVGRKPAQLVPPEPPVLPPTVSFSLQAPGPEKHPFGIRIEGAPSERKDDAKSTVTCPENTYAVECFCKDRSNCDGAKWETPRTCAVFNAATATVPSVAVTVCSLAANFASQRLYTAQGISAGAQLICKRGLVMTGCAINDPWSQLRRTGVVNDYKSCTWVKLYGAEKPNPTMTALCVRPHGDLFLGRPKGRPGPPSFGRLPCLTPPFSVALQGAPSELADDAISTVQCPANTFAVKCFCKDASNCDGAMWTFPHTCKVQNKAGASAPSIAVVKCLPRHAYGDTEIVTGASIPERSRIFCPPGFGMKGCIINDPWSQHRQTRVIRDDTSCYWVNLSLFTRKFPTLTGHCVKPLLRFGHLFAQGRPPLIRPFPLKLPFFGPPRVRPRPRPFRRGPPGFGPPRGPPPFRPFPLRPPFYGLPPGHPPIRPFRPRLPLFGPSQDFSQISPFLPTRAQPQLNQFLHKLMFPERPLEPKGPPFPPIRPFFGPALGPDPIAPFPARFPFFGPAQGPNENRPAPPKFGPHGLFLKENPFGISLQGPPTAREDHAPSSIYCPANTFVARCMCKDFRNCAGSQWDSPNTCTVKNAVDATVPSVPAARCSPLLTEGDAVVVKGESIPIDEKIKCPEGKRMLGCAIMDPWSQERKTSVINDGTSCYWLTLSGEQKNNPTLTAMCLKDIVTFGVLVREQTGIALGDFAILVQGLPNRFEDNEVKSTFTCPADRYAAKCFCEDTMTCAGAMWESPRTCSAFSPAAAVAVTASVRAVCLKADLFSDVKVLTKQVPAGEKIKCPEGYGMTGCARKDSFTRTRIIDLAHDDKSCLWIKLSGMDEPKPTLTAICLKLKNDKTAPEAWMMDKN